MIPPIARYCEEVAKSLSLRGRAVTALRRAQLDSLEATRRIKEEKSDAEVLQKARRD